MTSAFREGSESGCGGNADQLSLRTQILTALIALTMVPLVIVAYQGYHCGREAVREYALNHVSTVLSLKLTQTRTAMQTAEGELRILADQLSHIPAMSQDLRKRMLKGLLDQREAYQSLLLLNPDKAEEFGIDRGGKRARHPLDQEFLSRLTSGNKELLVFSQDHLHDDHKLAVHIGVPIKCGGSDLS